MPSRLFRPRRRSRSVAAACIRRLLILALAAASPLAAHARAPAQEPAGDPPPPAPEGLTAVALGPTLVALSWNPVTEAEGGVLHYVVYRNGTEVATPQSTSYSDSDVQAETRYEYQVSAVDAKNREGARSEKVAVTTPPDATPPTSPTDLEARAGGPTSIDLQWDAAEDPESGIAEYRIYRDAAVVGTSESTSFTDTGLQPETTYSYFITAVNGAGLEGLPSATETEQTETADDDGDDGGGDDGDDGDDGGDGGDDDGGADASPPTAPTDLEAEAAGPRRIDLDWAAAEDPESGVSEYRIYRGGAAVATVGGNTTSYSDSGLEPETTYEYQVAAVNGAGLEGSPSAAASATTPAEAETDVTPPPAPGGLQAEAVGPTEVRLTWDAATDPESGIEEYRIYRDGNLVDSSTTTSYTDTTVAPGQEYRYRVRAVNGQGLEGDPSAAATVSTLRAEDTVPPAPPTGLRVVS